MTIKLQGKWEAERIADILAACGSQWAHDCAERMRRQIDAEKERIRDK